MTSLTTTDIADDFDLFDLTIPVRLTFPDTSEFSDVPALNGSVDRRNEGTTLETFFAIKASSVASRPPLGTVVNDGSEDFSVSEVQTINNRSQYRLGVRETSASVPGDGFNTTMTVERAVVGLSGGSQKRTSWSADGSVSGNPLACRIDAVSAKTYDDHGKESITWDYEIRYRDAYLVSTGQRLVVDGQPYRVVEAERPTVGDLLAVVTVIPWEGV